MAKQRQMIIRSRAIRGRILEVLITLHSAAPGMAMQIDELVGQVGAGSPFSVDVHELQAELLAMAEKHLIELANDHARITANGSDFCRAGLPWDGVDAFSGGMR